MTKNKIEQNELIALNSIGNSTHHSLKEKNSINSPDEHTTTQLDPAYSDQNTSKLSTVEQSQIQSANQDTPTDHLDAPSSHQQTPIDQATAEPPSADQTASTDQLTAKAPPAQLTQPLSNPPSEPSAPTPQDSSPISSLRHPRTSEDVQAARRADQARQEPALAPPSPHPVSISKTSQTQETSARLVPWPWIIGLLLLIIAGTLLYSNPSALKALTGGKKQPKTGPSHLDKLAEQLKSAKAPFNRAAVERDPTALSRLEASCAKGRCDYLSTCLPSTQNHFNQLVNLKDILAKPEAEVARFAFHFHSCALPALQAELLALREQAQAAAPRLASGLQQLKVSSPSWGLCISQEHVEVFESIRVTFSEAMRVAPDVLFMSEDSYYKSIKSHFATSLKSPSQTLNLIGELLSAGDYYVLETPMSARFSHLIELTKESLNNPEGLCK